MLFNSLHFVIFFPIVVFLYFGLRHRYRWILLLAASYYFYAAWRPEYLLLIIFSTIVDYVAGRGIGGSATKKGKIIFLLASLATNLGLLFAFKYYNFFSSQLQWLFDYSDLLWKIPELDVLLPVGISFYTFQTLSYTIDVFRGEREPEKHLGYFAVYVSFFPQLVAGPIERSTSLMPQFFEKKKFSYANVTDGVKLMLWGFFKKLVIADRLAIYVNEVYNHPDQYYGLPVILATVFFAYQIYCDFSGYSDIAIGSAQVMGYKLMTNFRRPYFAQSIREFWQRWHISLSTWFRDYLYISLGGNRVSKCRNYFNLLATFVISGLWHGANWTFIIWGFLHGAYLITSIWTTNIRRKFNKTVGLDFHPALHAGLRIAFIFVLANISWVFFRANSLSDAFLIFHNMTRIDFSHLGINVALNPVELFVAIAMIVFLEVIQVIQERNGSVRELLNARPVWVRWSAYYAIIVFILFFGMFKSEAFIYFQF